MTKREIIAFVEKKQEEAVNRAKAEDLKTMAADIAGAMDPNKLTLMDSLCEQVLEAIEELDLSLTWCTLVMGLEEVRSKGLAVTLAEDLKFKANIKARKTEDEYRKLLGNIRGMKAAEAEAYLWSLGFTLPEVRKPVEKPMIVPVAKEWL